MIPAFASAPPGMLDPNPKNRAQLTGVLTNLILPGTVLAADIGKAIDHGNGKAILATMGGNLDRDQGGRKDPSDRLQRPQGDVTQADEQYSNGVVHHVDALLLPAKSRRRMLPASQPEGPAR